MAITLAYPLQTFAANPIQTYTFKVSPYYMKDDNGKAGGAAFEFHKKLMEMIGQSAPTVKTMPGKRLKEVFKKEKNVLLFPLVFKPDRVEFVDFLYHTHSSTMNFIAYGDTEVPDALKNKDFGNLPSNIKIGVNRGTIFEKVLVGMGMPAANLSPGNSTEQNFSKLFKNRIQFVFVSPGIKAGVFKNNPEFASKEKDTKLIVPPVKNSIVYVGANKNFDPALRQQIFDAIDKMYKEGFIAELFGKHGYIMDGPRHHDK